MAAQFPDTHHCKSKKSSEAVKSWTRAWLERLNNVGAAPETKEPHFVDKLKTPFPIHDVDLLSPQLPHLSTG